MDSGKRIVFMNDEETGKPIRFFIGYTNEEYMEFLWNEVHAEAMQHRFLRQAMAPKRSVKSKQQKNIRDSA